MKLSEGARLLAKSGDSIRVIADKIGASKEMARQWRTGGKLPSAESRESLAKEYGIPPKSWDQTPKGEGKKSKATKPASKAKATAKAKPASALATPAPEAVATVATSQVATEVDVERRLREQMARQRLHEQLARLDEMRLDPDATVAGLIQIERLETQALSALGRITGEISAISEETIVRHPAFKRVLDAILRALDKHPGALADVEAALAGLDG